MNTKVLALATLAALFFLASACATPSPAPTPTEGGTPPPSGEAGSLGEVRLGTEPVIAFSPLSYSGSAQQTGLWVSGQGTAAAAPDVALLQVGVEVQDKTVAEAQRRARQAMNAIVKVLRDGGVAEKDIKTTSFNIYQVTRWIDRLGRDEVIGYRVSHMASIKFRDLDKVGGFIDAVAEAGGDITRIHGISFTVDDPTPHLEAAREVAIKDALAKAQQIARLAGITLGKPIYITENVSYPTPIVYRGIAMKEGAIAAEAPTSISPGENQFTASVQMVFALQ